jgi:hypothetical protein
LAVVPPVTTLSLNTFAPVVTATANQVVTPLTTSLVLATFAPVVTIGGGNQTVTPSTLAFVLQAFAPTVITPSAPTVTVGGGGMGGGGGRQTRPSPLPWLLSKKRAKKAFGIIDEDKQRQTNLSQVLSALALLELEE